MADWFKRSWAQLLVLLGVALGALAVFFTRKRDVPTMPPPAPVLPPVELPPVNPTPSTTYQAGKDAPVDVGTPAGTDSLVNGINTRYGNDK